MNDETATDATETTEVVALATVSDAAIAATLAAELADNDEAQEHFNRYKAANEAGLIMELFLCTLKHGKDEQYRQPVNGPAVTVARWEVKRDGLSLAAFAFPDCSLMVMRNGDCVLDDRDGATVLFDVGQGLWLKAFMLEHAKLERQAEQVKRLAERQTLQQKAARNNRPI